MITILNCSPRCNGNSDKISQKIIKDICKNELDYTYKKMIEIDYSQCVDCGYCKVLDGCRFKDDDLKLATLLSESKTLIIIAPIHFDSVSIEGLKFISRLNFIHHNNRKLDIDTECNIKNLFLCFHGGSKSYSNQFKYAKRYAYYLKKYLNSEYVNVLNLNNTDNVEISDKELYEFIDKIIEKNR